jgi:energy-coupling factor transport system permease protein
VATRIPILYQERDTVIHRRDPRAKMALFALLFVFLFVAPTWQWMLLASILGLTMAIVTRTQWKWLLVLWLIHLPSFIVIVGIPVGKMLFGEGLEMNEDLAEGLRLVLAWSGAIFVSLSLFSTMDPNDVTNGLWGLGVPAVAAFAVGLTYRLLYVTLNDILQIADAMKLKGVDLETKNPFRFAWNALQLSLPVLFTVVRRAPVLMAALEMRGFQRQHGRRLPRVNAGDLAFLGSGLLVFGLALTDRLGRLPSLGTLVGLS